MGTMAERTPETLEELADRIGVDGEGRLCVVLREYVSAWKADRRRKDTRIKTLEGKRSVLADFFWLVRGHYHAGQLRGTNRQVLRAVDDRATYAAALAADCEPAQGGRMAGMTPPDEVSIVDSLRHMADDHPCCKGGLLAVADYIEALEKKHFDLRVLVYRFLHRPNIWPQWGVPQFKIDAGLMDDEVALAAGLAAEEKP